MADLITLQSQVDEIYQTYASHFSGRPRATRDPKLLEQLIARLEGSIDNANQLLNGSRNPAVLQILDTANQNLERYIDELKAIKTVQSDPRAIFAAELAEQANRVFDLYTRHFAGKDRGTRDFLLLNAMADSLNELELKMSQLVEAGVEQSAGDRDSVVTQRNMYREEIANIKQAQKSGSAEERANRLAQLANAQFTAYRTFYSGKSRVSRSLERLNRMMSNLKSYRRDMQALASEGFSSEQNNKNIEVVTANLSMYKTELDAIEAAKSETSARDLAGALGGSANTSFETYRENFAGVNRTEADGELLSDICDELFDIAQQMRDISDEIDIDINEQNLKIVEQNLALYEREFRAIAEAQKT